MKWFGIPFSSGQRFVRILHHDPSNLKALYGMAQSFMEFYKAVVHAINLLVFCDCGFHSVCPLMDEDNRLMEASWWDRLTQG